MQQLNGIRLWSTVTGLCLALLLSTLESSIVATALVSIAASFGDYAKSSWVVETYLLTYTSFLAIFARLSDVYGRKRVLLTGIGFFVLFSLACGVSRNLTELLIFRALQGIGGSSVFAISFALVADITPPKHFGLASGAVSAVFAISSILGPILGGAISSSHATSEPWRWCFYLNIPGGAIAFAVLLFICPDDYDASANRSSRRLSQIDWPGFVLLVIASALVVYGIEEGGISHAWNGAPAVATLAVGGVFWILFGCWETFLASARYTGTWLPVFPIRLVTSRVTAAVLLSAFLTGFPFQTTVIYLPQRFQIENGLSPVGAGIRMLPLLLVSAVGTAIAGSICSKRNLSFYTMTSGLCLQIVGLGLFSSLPVSVHVQAAQYGYQAILGLGFGMTLSSVFVMIKAEVKQEDLAVGIGASTQIRVLGGLVGVAVGQAVVSATLKSVLADSGPPGLLQAITRSTDLIAQLPSEQAAAVRLAYGKAFTALVRVVLYIAIASLVIVLFAFRSHPPSLLGDTRSSDPERTTSDTIVGHVKKPATQEVQRVETTDSRANLPAVTKST